MLKHTFLTILIGTLTILNTRAQLPKESALFKTLQEQDSIFFERGFNQCDLTYLDQHTSDKLRFYHDQSGFQDKKTFFENTKKYICTENGSKPIRKVEVESLEVFPLANPLQDNGKIYGAIQQGVHHFFLRSEDGEEKWTSTAKFTHVWVLEDDSWKLSEVLSYNHQSEDPEAHKFDIEKLLAKSNVPALGLGIINDGEVTHLATYGTLDKHRTAPYHTIFKVASLTKPVVSLLTLKLIDKGLLQLNEPLYKYWIDPDLHNDKRVKLLTPYIILTHQTGFPNWRYSNKNQKLDFQFDPGSQYQYSGEGFEYLRRALERKFNKSIEELADEMIFAPLKMKDTHFWWNKEVDESRYAQNFDFEGTKIELEKYQEANAAANLLTTVKDYSTFIAYIINGAGLSEELFKQMISPQLKLKNDDYFGLGWEILTNFKNEEYALLHTGKDPGVSTLAIWFPQSKNGYIIFLNGDNVDEIYKHLLNEKLYLGKELWKKR
ncbi:class A beta-lactamase-related serine hydrolase [Mesonia sp.]|uniref:class A beta-lactamase-related serine hydrolase n=1 Tax=Mesonia sp. TaxID=1960830 RepID=UPI00176B822B|nr:class A beta-lactamase-related serine hydrolase [Mesonia sp.]HIB38434.1 DUF4440 domain-containing protein [Mesonia sp.]HIO26812.1 DUF4440 domain-containing protein [Flavobacteriaceae bacterium]